MAVQSDRPFVVAANGGDTVHLPMGGIGVQFKIDGQQTSGRVSVVEHPVAPGAFALPHTHAREDEISYVLEGRIAAEIDGREMMVEEGEYLLKPRGLKHAFWNPTDHPARLMEIIAPAGLEQFFRIMATLRPMPGSADYDRAMALLAESAVQTHFEERDAFLARHGLSASVPGRTGSLAETAVESRD